MNELEFGERLKQLRKAKNLTQQELADRLGVSNKSVSRWESGSYPDIAMLGKLAKELGVTVDDLLGEAPPLRELNRSDWQNLLSFAFAIGGGVVFYLLDLFMPTALCYILYICMMAYGVYLQKNYTFHSQWFHVANLVMNLFVNFRIGSGITALLVVIWYGTSVSLETLVTNALLVGISGNGYILFLIFFPVLLAVLLTAGTGLAIRRYWDDRIRLSRRTICFTPRKLTATKVLPVVCPIILAGYWFLFRAETSVLPGYVYLHQKQVFYLLWAVLTALSALELLLTKQKGMLLPMGVMQLFTLTFSGLCTWQRFYGTGTGNIYAMEGLNPSVYVRFGQATGGTAVLAIVLVLLYLLCCCVSLRREDGGRRS